MHQSYRREGGEIERIERERERETERGEKLIQYCAGPD